MIKNSRSRIATALLLLILGGITLNNPVATSAATTGFTFKNSMTEDVLRNYASRAVTLAGFCVEGLDEDPVFEEDLRMVQRIGAKFIGRSAYYSWSGNLSSANIEQHYATAKRKADLVHRADPEIILQAAVFEIMYKQTVNNTAIPSWVFEAFSLPVEKRNFRWNDMLFPEGNKYYAGFWGNNESAVPYILKQETQMYFYYCIRRYIDAGYESVHLGQAEMMMNYGGNTYAKYWDAVTSRARAYAEDHARRGIILFDCHTAIDSGGIKVGNRLVMDIQAAGLVPNETEQKNGAMMCEISDFNENWLQWIGRSSGGEHPLGFTIEHNITILEFDNYGGNGNPGVATYKAFYNWGYDDITWFAVQPEWYRNQFLKECSQYLKTHNLDSKKRQVYFLQMPCRRCLTADPNYPEFIYTPTASSNVDFIFDYAAVEKSVIQYNAGSNNYTVTVKKDYRANRRSDGCPNGFNQEDTMREIFLGVGAAENPAWNKIVFPAAYVASSEVSASSSSAVSNSHTGISAAKSTASGTSSSDHSSNSAASGSESEAPGNGSSTDQLSAVSGTDSANSGSTAVPAANSNSSGTQGKVHPAAVVALTLLLLAGIGTGGYFLIRRKRKV